MVPSIIPSTSSSVTMRPLLPNVPLRCIAVIHDVREMGPLGSGVGSGSDGLLEMLDASSFPKVNGYIPCVVARRAGQCSVGL